MGGGTESGRGVWTEPSVKLLLQGPSEVPRQNAEMLY